MADGQLLPSWNDSAAKSAILDFVACVTEPGGAEFVPRDLVQKCYRNPAHGKRTPNRWMRLGTLLMSISSA
jgi:hypothetical protein